MAKTIDLNYKGKTYTLEYTRSSIRRMERDGFDTSSADANPMTAVYVLFKGAFYAHHRNIDSKVVDDIFDKLDNLHEWADDLLDMYKDTFEPTNEGEEDDGAGEITRTKSW